MTFVFSHQADKQLQTSAAYCTVWTGRTGWQAGLPLEQLLVVLSDSNQQPEQPLTGQDAAHCRGLWRDAEMNLCYLQCTDTAGLWGPVFMYDTDNGHVLTTRNTVLLGFSHRCKKKKERPFIVQSGQDIFILRFSSAGSCLLNFRAAVNVEL